MNAVWFIFVVGLLNTCLGFAIAVHLGRRYRAATEAEGEWDFDNDLPLPEKPVQTAVSEPAPEPVAQPTAVEPEVDVQAEAPTPSEESSATAPSAEASEPAEPATPVAAEAEAVPADTAASDDVPSPADEITPPSAPPAPEAEVAASAEPPAETSADPIPEVPDKTRTSDPLPSTDPSVLAERSGAATPEIRPESQAESNSAPNDRVLGPPERTEQTDGATAPAAALQDGPEAESQPQPDHPEQGTTGTKTPEAETAGAALGDDASGPAGSDPPAAQGTDPSTPSADKSTETEAAPAPAEEAATAASDNAAPQARSSKPSDLAASEKAIEAFLAEVSQYQGELDKADAELRMQAENPDGDSIRACLESLVEAGREYAGQREQAREQLGHVWGEVPEFAAVGERLHGTMRRQDEQIESTERAIAAFPYDDNLSQGCRVMIDETARLMDANLLVRDALNEAGAAAVRGAAPAVELTPARRSDPLTGADSRVALEQTLVEWLSDEADGIDSLAVAAIDVDGFSQINRQFGYAAGNLLLQAIGKLLLAEQRSKTRLARSGGERFVMLFPDADLREATNAVERLRQIVERASFDHKHDEIRVTVSCGVTDAIGDDTPESILARAEATLMEAKRYGRNRTFLHEGKYPTPVVPPKFPIEPRRMPL